MSSLEWAATYFGVMKTGAAVAPLTFRFASSDIKYVADVPSSEVLIFDSGFLRKIQPVQRGIDYVKYYICVGEDVLPDVTSYSGVLQNACLSQGMVWGWPEWGTQRLSK